MHTGYVKNLRVFWKSRDAKLHPEATIVLFLNEEGDGFDLTLGIARGHDCRESERIPIAWERIMTNINKEDRRTVRDENWKRLLNMHAMYIARTRLWRGERNGNTLTIKTSLKSQELAFSLDISEVDYWMANSSK